MTPRITAHVCYSDTGVFTGPVSSCANLPAEDLLNWLIFSSSTLTPSGTKVVWDLNTFGRAILDRLPVGVVARLSRPPHRARFGNYKLFYIPDKVFSVNKDGSEASYYELSQYFPGEPEPKTVDGLQEKASQLQQALSELGIDNPPSLSSPVACFKNHELIKGLEGAVPTVFDAPEDTLDAYELALECTPREWIGNYQIGHFPELWKFDISSAYPYYATMLPDLRDCVIYKAGGTDVLADYGFLVGDFTVYPDHPLAFCSPFLADRGDGILINFVGTRRDYTCTLDDVRCLRDQGMGEFHFKSGWLITEVADSPRRPFANTMNELFAMRGDSPLKSFILKRVMNGVIGRLLETRGDGEGNVLEYGDSFNPIYHALVTTPVRLQVFNFLVDRMVREDELVHVGVDGVRLTHRLALPGQAPMGSWRCAGYDPAFVLSPGGIVSRGQNFKRTGYDGLLAECAHRPTAYRLGMDRKDPIDLRRLFLTQTRGFPELPRRARDLMTKTFLSEPVHLGT
jgi:hypothetical protein